MKNADWQSIVYLAIVLAAAVGAYFAGAKDIATMLVGAAIGAPVGTAVMKPKA